MPFGRKGFKVAHDPEATRHKEADTRRTKKEESLQEWLHAKEDFFDGIEFFIEYLGYSEVTEPTGRQNSAEIIHRLMQKKNIQKETLVVTANGLKIKGEDFDQSHPMAFVHIYRISWTMIDRIRKRLFCFIARDKTTKKLLLHVFQCNSKREASTITLTVAQAFQIAFDVFQKKDEETRKAVKQKMKEQEMEDAKAAAEGDEADGIYEEIPDELKKKPETDEANSEKQEETTAKQEGAEKQEESADQEPKLRGRPLQRRRSSRRVSVKLRHRQSTKRPTTSEDEDKLIEMPDEDIKEEFKRLTLRRETPDLPEMDFDPDDKTDQVAQFLTGEKTAEGILEEEEEAN